MVFRPQGDDYVLVEFGENVLDFELRFRAHALMVHLEQEKLPGILNLTPGIRSLQVHYDARPYGGPVTVFQPEECANDPRYSWRSLVPDLFEQSHADSDTWEMLRDDRLWRTLEARLAAADAA